MGLWNKDNDLTSAPKFSIDSKGSKGQDMFNSEVFLYDEAVDNINHIGWIKITNGTGGRSGRSFKETLIALRPNPVQNFIYVLSTDNNEIVVADDLGYLETFNANT